MLCRQRYNLIAPADEGRVAGDNDRIDPVLDEIRERRREVVLAASIDRVKLQPERTRRRLNVSGFAYGVRIVGVHEIADHGGGGHQLVQQLQPFRRNRPDEKADAGNICARPVEAGDETSSRRESGERDLVVLDASDVLNNAFAVR